MIRAFRSLSASALALAGVSSLGLILACGGGNSANTQGQSGSGAAPVSFLVTDAPTDAWSNIGVIIRKVVLIPAGGTIAQGVTIYDGTGDTAKLNLVDLDELAELLGTAQIPAGSYDRLVVTIDGNPSDIDLIASDGTAKIGRAHV
jgi:hypothetical protein